MHTCCTPFPYPSNIGTCTIRIVFLLLYYMVILTSQVVLRYHPTHCSQISTWLTPGWLARTYPLLTSTGTVPASLHDTVLRLFTQNSCVRLIGHKAGILYLGHREGSCILWRLQLPRRRHALRALRSNPVADKACCCDEKKASHQRHGILMAPDPSFRIPSLLRGRTVVRRGRPSGTHQGCHVRGIDP